MKTEEQLKIEFETFVSFFSGLPAKDECDAGGLYERYLIKKMRKILKANTKSIEDNFLNQSCNEHDQEVRRNVTKSIVEKIEKRINDFDDHICAFNDGDCECKCYKKALEDIKSKIKQ